MTKVPATTGEIIRALNRIADRSRDGLDASWLSAGLDASWLSAAIGRLAELRDAAKTAPDMLAALIGLLAISDENERGGRVRHAKGSHHDLAIKAARAAIAKAEGRMTGDENETPRQS